MPILRPPLRVSESTRKRVAKRTPRFHSVHGTLSMAIGPLGLSAMLSSSQDAGFRHLCAACRLAQPPRAHPYFDGTRGVMFVDHKTGSCLCGAVRFDITGPLRPVIACHCTQCR